jgi:glycolate oxidase
VAALLGFASERGIAVLPRGAGTNLCGGFAPSPESVVLDLSAMREILAIDPDARRAVVEPGVINGDLQQRLAPMGLCYSPDPASSAISSIGGNIAENAGGPGCIKYGVTFHHVAAVEVVLGDGRVAVFAEGDDIDLLGVMIGSEGILGAVTRATVKLRPLPAATWTALAAFDRLEDAALLVSEIIAAGVLPAALEMCDQRQVNLCEDWLQSGYPRSAAAILFAELDGDPDEVAAQAAILEPLLRRRDGALRVATEADERARLWAGRVGAAHAFKATGKNFYVCDVSVPRQRIPEMVARARDIASRLDLDVATAAHLGDGNMHPVILYSPEEADRMRAGADTICAAALDMGGTLTGEHGIGTEKVPHMRRRFGAAEIAAFRVVKAAFDPAGILNPGVLLPAVADDEPRLPRFAAAIQAALAGEKPATGVAGIVTADSTVAVDAENLTVSVGAGASCGDAVELVARAGFAGPGLLFARTLAELVEESGNRGLARSTLLAVEAELDDGPTVTFGSAAVKDVAGLDLKRLVAGGHGAFGRVRSATFRISPR